MPLPRIASDGSNFSVALWTALIDALETTESVVVGVGVVSGLEITGQSGLNIAISDGVMSSRSAVSFAGLPTFPVPANATRYIWIDEYGTINGSTTFAAPSPNSVCLGKVTTSGSAVIAVSTDGRMEFLHTLQNVAQAGGYCTVPVSNANVTLNASQYRCRVIEFTGTLTSNLSVTVPSNAGYEWTVVDSTSGAFAITFKTQSGTGVTLAHGKTCKLFSDGTNIRRATADV